MGPTYISFWALEQDPREQFLPNIQGQWQDCRAESNDIPVLLPGTVQHIRSTWTIGRTGLRCMSANIVVELRSSPFPLGRSAG